MKKLFYILPFLFLFGNISAQKSPFAVEVSAFAEPAPDGQFGDLEGIYETLDANYIYRYYIDAATKEDAETLKIEVQKKGFIHAKVVDFAQLKGSCDAICQYTPPEKTGHEIVPFNSLSTEYIDIQHLYAIFFDYDKTDIRPDAQEELNKLVIVMKQNPSYRVVILAHTDARGSSSYNEALSMKRATVTQQYLTRQGIHRTKIEKEIFGEKKPIAPNVRPDGQDNEKGRRFNRRVEFKIIDSQGKVLNLVDKIRVPEEVNGQ